MSNEESIRLLYIEDDETSAEVTLDYLKYDANKHFEVTRVCTLNEGLDFLDKECKTEDDCNIDIILLDLVLPNSHGVATYEAVTKKSKCIPIVVISGYEDLAIKCMKLGAQDYLVKPSYTPHSLLRVLRYSFERSKLAREKLKLEKKYKRILNHTPVGFHNYEYRDNCLYLVGYNPSADKILGIDHSELIGKKIHDAFPALEGTPIKEEYMKVAKTGKPYSDIVEYTDDSIPHSFFKVHVFQTSYNDITVSFEDITNQLLMDRKYKSLIEATNAGIYEIDFRTNKFVYVNHKIIEQTGYTKDELLSMQAHEILTEDSIKKWLSRIEALNRGEYIDKTAEYTAIKKDGTLVYVIVTAEFIEDSDGKIIGANVVTIDITESVLAKKETKRKEEEIFNELENRIHSWRNELNINVHKNIKYRDSISSQLNNLKQHAEVITNG